MAVTVAKVTPARLANLSAAYPTAIANYDPTLACSPTPPGMETPDIDWITRIVNESPQRFTVLLGVDAGTFAGLTIAHDASRTINWFLPNHKAPLAPQWKAASDAVLALYGIVQGSVANPRVRAFMLANDPTGTFDTDGRFTRTS